MLALPWPPTVNTYYRNVNGRTLISKRGRQYRKAVSGRALEERFPRLGAARIQIEIDAFPPDRRKRDIDNLLKGLLDSLNHAGCFDDDEQIDDLRIRRRFVVKGGAVMVRITPAKKQ